MNRVYGNVTDGQILIVVLLGGNVPAPSLDPHFDLEAAAFAHGSEIDVLIQNFDVRIFLDHSGGYLARLIDYEAERLHPLDVDLQGNLLEVQNNVGSVFHHAPNQRKLMHHALDANGGDRRAFNRGKQHPAERVSNRRPESALKRLGLKLAVLVGQRVQI